MSMVIKAGTKGRRPQRLATLDLADHAAEARRIIADGRRRAAQILVDARRERDRLVSEIRETAYEAGYKAGKQEGTVAGREAAYNESIERFSEANGRIVADLVRVVDEVDGIKRDLRIAAERDLLEFALGLAEKLTFAVGRKHDDAATTNLRRALELVQSKRSLVIRAHPDDTAAMTAFAEAGVARLDGSSAVHLVPDESIAPGGCVVKTETTHVDARLETQIAELVSLLLPEGSGHD